MKVFAISDLHLSLNNPKPMDIFGGAWENYIDEIVESWNTLVSDEDIVIISGDISWAMNLSDAIDDLNFIGNLPGYKIILRGNHDYWWKSISSIRKVLPKKMFAIQNDCLRIDDVLICGSRGWTVPEGKNQSEDDKKIFDREVIRMELSLKEMSKMRKSGDKVFCMVHYPPFNSRFENTPFTDLFEKFEVDAVIYGHLHGRDSRAKLTLNKNGLDYYLTSCDKLNNVLKQIL